MTTNSILSVSFVQRPSRPGYDPSTDDVGEDVVCVVSVGSAFHYIIPSFSVLAVEMRQTHRLAACHTVMACMLVTKKDSSSASCPRALFGCLDFD